VAAGDYAVVAGGVGNHSTTNYSTISGGTRNHANGSYATVSGGSGNKATGASATVCGGGDGGVTADSNVASGEAAIVCGGSANHATGRFSFAAGRRARAITNSTFVWSDNQSGIFESTNIRQFLIRAANGVGINTNNPSADLHVNGDICYTGSIGACSDGRYKSGIAKVPHALERVSKLRGVQYRWKRDEFPDHKFDDKEHLGFVAQEIEPLFPEVVMTDKNGYKSVDYGRLTPVLVEAIKEQQDQIVEQQKQIDELRSLIDHLIAHGE
jgi:hypothetical protein